MLKWFVNIIQKLFFPCKIYGKENIPKSGRCVIISNHLYFADPGYFYCNLKRKLLILGKKELFNTKFKDKFFHSLGVLPVDREKVSPQTLKVIIKTLQAEGAVFLCPEGTRNKKNYDLQPFKDGCSLFALMTKAPVIPCYLSSRGGVFHRVKIYVGKPIDLDEYYCQKATKDVCDAATEVIRDNMQKLKICADDLEQKKLPAKQKQLLATNYDEYRKDD